MGTAVVPLVAQLADSYAGPDALEGGWAGIIALAAPTIIEPPRSGRKRKPSMDMTFRVWRMHRRVWHWPQVVLARMAKMGLLGPCDVEWWEFLLVADHQDCYACALAKWKRLPDDIPSGLHPTIPGRAWSFNV